MLQGGEGPIRGLAHAKRLCRACRALGAACSGEADRLALITAVVLPVTAIASVYGMNLIVGQRTDIIQLVAVLVLMGAVTVGMLAWTKRMGWW